MIILGITGTLGAGKGAMVEYLKERYGFAHYSARDFLIQEIEKRGLPVNRDSMVLVGNDLRATYHPGFIAEELAKEAVRENHNAVIESIRTLGEIAVLKQQPNFYLLAIDADQLLRFERIKSRASATDDVSFDKFKADEEREMFTTDPNKQNLTACLAVADFRVMNNGNLADLHRELDIIITQII